MSIDRHNDDPERAAPEIERRLDAASLERPRRSSLPSFEERTGIAKTPPPHEEPHDIKLPEDSRAKRRSLKKLGHDLERLLVRLSDEKTRESLMEHLPHLEVSMFVNTVRSFYDKAEDKELF